MTSLADPLNDGRCLWGWGPARHYPGGHGCNREYRHRGRCKCDCDATKQRPARWDDEERQEMNR